MNTLEEFMEIAIVKSGTERMTQATDMSISNDWTFKESC
jgi:hypothetical protein